MIAKFYVTPFLNSDGVNITTIYKCSIQTFTWHNKVQENLILITHYVIESIMVSGKSIESAKLRPSCAQFFCCVIKITTDIGANLQQVKNILLRYPRSSSIQTLSVILLQRYVVRNLSGFCTHIWYSKQVKFYNACGTKEHVNFDIF